MNLSYLPTPLLGQDMTQGQFLSGVSSSSSSSSYRAGSTDIPYPLSPLLPIVQRPR